MFYWIYENPLLLAEYGYNQMSGNLLLSFEITSNLHILLKLKTNRNFSWYFPEMENMHMYSPKSSYTYTSLIVSEHHELILNELNFVHHRRRLQIYRILFSSFFVFKTYNLYVLYELSISVFTAPLSALFFTWLWQGYWILC